MKFSLVFVAFGMLLGYCRACSFNLPYVAVTLFAQESGGPVPREVYLPLYEDAGDCLYCSRPNPTLPVRPIQNKAQDNETNECSGDEFPNSITKASLDSARFVNSASLSLLEDTQSWQSFLTFNNGLLGEALNNEMLLGLVICTVTTTDGIGRRFRVGADLVFATPLSVKWYQCVMDRSFVKSGI
jgi:hypothetical protein